MKKLYILFMMMMGFAIQSNSQNLYTFNFDTLTPGVYAALTMGAPWTTWSAAPGGAEDAHISNAQFHSDSNSVNVTLNNDFVLNLGGKTTGRYKIQFYMFVDSGYLGYYNVLNDFNGASSIWGFQVYVYNDSIFIDAGGTTAVKSTFPFKAWNKMDLIVDVDDDFATFLINDVEKVSYKWSKGAQGTGSTFKLGAIDFYGWDGTSAPTTATGTAGYFIDDVTIDQMTPPEAPSNLNATYNSGTQNIDVTWTAPTTTPDLYKLSRNGNVVYSGTTASYTDVKPWANDYGYAARAFYTGQGYSHSSNVDSATVPGGVQRDLVLMEGATGTWCQYCPGAAMGLRDLIETNHKNAVAIEYHSGDTYEVTASAARVSYYNVTGFPTVVADGTQQVVGGSATASMYSSYLPLYNERIASKAFYNLDVNVVQDSADYYTATITVDESFKAFASGWKLHTALTESNIPVAWGNQTEVDFACRAMYPNENGTDLNFASSSTQTVTIHFSTAGFVKNNCEFVVFVQHDASKEVAQAAKVDMSSIAGIEEIQGTKVSLYPNPASQYMMLLSSGKGNVEIYNLSGNLVYTSRITKVTQYVDVSAFSKGVYVVKVFNSDKNFTQKLVIE